MQLKVNGRDVDVDDRHDSAPLLWVRALMQGDHQAAGLAALIVVA